MGAAVGKMPPSWWDTFIVRAWFARNANPGELLPSAAPATVDVVAEHYTLLTEQVCLASDHRVVDDLSLTLPAHRTTFILDAHTCGKSTLL